MKTLIEMTDFVLEQDKLDFIPKYKDYADEWSDHCLLKLDKINNYAHLLKQERNLGMFVPAVENNGVWEFLEEPKESSYKICPTEAKRFVSDKLKFQSAKEKVLFEGFEIDMRGDVFNETLCVTNEFSQKHKNIEDLIPYNLTLTENALKIIGL